MLDGVEVSFVKACQDFFSTGEHGKKVEIPEFRELTRPDKESLRLELIEVGYNVAPLPEPSAN